MISILKKFSIVLEKKQKKKVAILFFMMLIGAFLEVLGVTLMLPLMTAIMQPNIIETNAAVAKVCEILDLHSHRTFVIACIAALIAVFIIKDTFLIFEYYVQNRFLFNNRFATQRKMLAIFMKRPYEYYLNAQSGEIFRMIQGDVDSTYSLLTTLLSFATESVVAAVLIVTIFLVDPLMTAFVAVMMGSILFLVAKVIKPILRREGLSRQENAALTNKWLIQAVNGIKEVKVAQKEQFFETNYEKSGRKLIRAERKNAVLGQMPRLLIEMVSVCSMLALIAIMIYRGREIETLLPSLGAFAMAAVKLMPSANRIVAASNAIAYLEPALDKMLENLKVLENEGELKLSHEKQRNTVGANDNSDETFKAEKAPSLTLEKEIALKSITYTYPESEQQVLKQADMVIPVGKSVGIVGVTGAGKTTAVDILMGLLDPQEGQVLADGVDVRENYSDWLTHIGYIPQSVFMLDDSIRANVAFGVPEEEIDDAEVWRALEEAQIADFVRTLPKGIHSRMGERGMRVSGGQRQRVSIARALYLNPELLVFDEATSALDNETEAAIMESINSLHGKKTMVIIAHRLQTIEGCDMVYRVADGKIKRER